MCHDVFQYINRSEASEWRLHRLPCHFLHAAGHAMPSCHYSGHKYWYKHQYNVNRYGTSDTPLTPAAHCEVQLRACWRWRDKQTVQLRPHRTTHAYPAHDNAVANSLPNFRILIDVFTWIRFANAEAPAGPIPVTGAQDVPPIVAAAALRRKRTTHGERRQRRVFLERVGNRDRARVRQWVFFAPPNNATHQNGSSCSSCVTAFVLQ